MHAMAQKATLALIVVGLSISGCGSNRADSSSRNRDAITKANHASGFAPFADIFPASDSTKPCSVAAGAPGDVFPGTCSTHVTLGRNGTSTVVFVQNFGVQGHHTWTIRVAPNEPPNVVRDSGGGLVQLVP